MKESWRTSSASCQFFPMRYVLRRIFSEWRVLSSTKAIASPDFAAETNSASLISFRRLLKSLSVVVCPARTWFLPLAILAESSALGLPRCVLPPISSGSRCVRKCRRSFWLETVGRSVGIADTFPKDRNLTKTKPLLSTNCHGLSSVCIWQTTCTLSGCEEDQRSGIQTPCCLLSLPSRQRARRASGGHVEGR